MTRNRRAGSSLLLLLPLAAVAVLTVALGAMAFSTFAMRSTDSATAGPTARAPASGGPSGPTAIPSGTAAGRSSTPSGVPTPGASPSLADTRIPLVPIVAFWSPLRSISRSELAELLAGVRGAPGTPTTCAVSATDLAGLAAELDVTPNGVKALAPAQVKTFVRATAGAIGIVRAEDVTPDVRAIAVDGVALFGAERIHDLRAWPLLVAEDGPPSTFSAAAAWTIAAGGDVMLDKAVYAQSIAKQKGVDFPWQGGNAVIDARICCGWGGPKLVTGHRTGGAGAVTSLFRKADLALANLEAPTPDRFTYHTSGFTFSADPALLAGLRDTGIDGVSLANNHMGNAGTQGVLDTLRHLDALGIEHAGAGPDQASARKAAAFSAGGERVAVLAYSDIQPESYWASAGHPGTAAYSMAHITADIRAARNAGATFVIVMPHWGQEYTDAVWSWQRDDARAMVAAGADLILASHSHWVGPLESIGGHAVFYSLGDLVFDWTHDERTQEGAIADLTFVGGTLVQVDLHPTLILDGAQPNLLDPAADGQVVLGAVRKASKAFLGW